MRWIFFAVATLMSITVAAAAGKKHDHDHGGKKEHREVKAHEHGHGKVNIAVEGKRLSIELEAPGADIVGFEHTAKTDAQKAVVAAAKAILQKPSDVMELPAAAGCKVGSASVELHGDGGKEAHNEFHAEYEFECSAIAKLNQIRFKYFKVFEKAEELEVSVISNTGAQKFEATPKQPEVKLSKLK